MKGDASIRGVCTAWGEVEPACRRGADGYRVQTRMHYQLRSWLSSTYVEARLMALSRLGIRTFGVSRSLPSPGLSPERISIPSRVATMWRSVTPTTGSTPRCNATAGAA